MSRQSVYLATAGVAAIMLVIGAAIGSLVFPTTKTTTTTSTLFPSATEYQTTTSMITTSSNSGISTVCEFGAEGSLIFTLQNSSNGNPLGSVPIQVTEVVPL